MTGQSFSPDLGCTIYASWSYVFVGNKWYWSFNLTVLPVCNFLIWICVLDSPNSTAATCINNSFYTGQSCGFKDVVGSDYICRKLFFKTV